MSIYTVFRHKVDLWNRTRTTNNAGQRKASWALGTTGQKCHYIPRITVVQTVPTYDEQETFAMFFPANTSITYGSRLYNLTDKKGNVIEAGPFEVVEILKQPGFSGKTHHLYVKSKRVIES